ncbi:MAG: tRNA-dihydrouridine synthase C [Saprospiraceae bacterium]|jgi:tRNA-dihydrouridine synthase C
MKLYLAPMQGVVDYNMRKILTEIGGYDRCVTEFIRVAQFPLPDKTFYRYCPELLTGGCTEAGIPVHIQLLGSEPGKIAWHAKQAQRLGALGIDLNFGCPAKVVNRHGGGSALLTNPALVGDIVKGVRDAVPESTPVSAKIRLGFANADLLSEIVERVINAGANELCIHARTRNDGYKPPAYWHYIADVNQTTACTIIVNGEVWSPQDANEAARQSGCQSLMLGRGALTTPDLALQIKALLAGTDYAPLEWLSVLAHVEQYFLNSDSIVPEFTGNRTKQWLAYLMRHYPNARPFFQNMKRSHDRSEIAALFTDARRQAESKLRWAS